MYTGVGQVSREVLDEKVAIEPAYRTGMVKSHPTSTSQIGHAIKLGSIGLDCQPSEIRALETDVAEKEALSGRSGRGLRSANSLHWP